MGKTARKIAFRAWQVLWGMPQTLAGLVLFAAHARCPHFDFHGAIATAWPRPSSVSLGMFVFVSDQVQGDAFERLLVHEYGHCIQSLVLGPAYLLVVGLPSVLWGYLPRNKRKRAATGRSYYQFVTERSANVLGKAVCGQDAPR